MLIASGTILSQTLTSEQIKKARKQQIRLFDCELMLLNRDSVVFDQTTIIKSQDQQIRNYKLTIKTFSEKEEMYLSERSYYLDQIRDRNKTIESFEKKRKLARIGLVALTGISGLLFGYVMLSK